MNKKYPRKRDSRNGTADKLQHLVSLLFSTERAIRESRKSGGIEQGTVLHCITLRIIAGENPTMSRIAERLRIAAPSATSLVQGLVKAGYVKRTRSKGDRRIVRMSITPSGRKQLGKMAAEMAKRVRDVLAPLSREQIDSLTGILELIKSAYEEKEITK